MLAGNVSECWESPTMGPGVERWIVGVLQKQWNCAPALLACEHAGLSQAARGFLANDRRGTVVHGGEQKRNGFAAADQRQPVYGPMARVFVRIFEMRAQSLHHSSSFDPTVAH